MRYIFLIICIGVTIQGLSQTYQNIEAVEYDPSQNRFFVSNGDNIIARSSTGILSFFGEGGASHGMEVLGNTLFVIDSNTIRGYDLVSEEEVMTLNIPGVGFLNGMANNGVSKLWVTDFSNGRIYEINVEDLENPTYLLVVSNTESTPNGIVYDYLNNRLVFVNWGSNASIKAVDPDSYDVTLLTGTNLGNCDGIDMTMQGDFFVSSWNPQRITKFNDDFSSSEIIEVFGLFNAADISWAEATDSLAIPNSGDDTVVFYSPTTTTIEDIGMLEERTKLFVVPNPIMSSSEIRFEVQTHSTVVINLFELNGSLTRSVCDGYFMPGKHAVNLDRANLSSGTYTIHVDINGGILKRQVIFE